MKIQIYTIFIIIGHIVNAQVSDFKSIDFTRADNMAKLQEGANLNNLPVLAHKLTHKLPTQVEKFRAIYYWVCHNITGDRLQFNKVESKRKDFEDDQIGYLQWNEKYKIIAFKKLLKQKKTMCAGYAYLIKELSNLANIKSIIINGYARSTDANVSKLGTPNHSWNVVELNGKWYLCDATWSSGYLDEKNSFVQEYNNGYFLTDPILFGKSHLPSEKEWLLTDKLNPESFIVAPLVYSETFEQGIVPISPNKMNVRSSKNQEINFDFKSLEISDFKTVELVRFTAREEKSLKISNLKKSPKGASFTYKFKNKGVYDTHLKVNGDIVASYTVEVSKN